VDPVVGERLLKSNRRHNGWKSNRDGGTYHHSPL
jgi:hypothetical protein